MTLPLLLNPKHFDIDGSVSASDMRLIYDILKKRKKRRKEKPLELPKEPEQRRVEKLLDKVTELNSDELIKQKLDYNLMNDTLDGIIESLRIYEKLGSDIERIQQEIKIHKAMRERRLMILRQMELARMISQMKEEEDLVLFLLLSDEDDEDADI